MQVIVHVLPSALHDLVDQFNFDQPFANRLKVTFEGFALRVEKKQRLFNDEETIKVEKNTVNAFISAQGPLFKS